LERTASNDLAFAVERLQQDPDPTKDAGDILAIEVEEVVLDAPAYSAGDDWVQRRLCALQEAASLPLVLAGQEFANHERQWLAKQAEQDARPYEVETEGFICGKCDNLQQNGPRCAVCGTTTATGLPARSSCSAGEGASKRATGWSSRPA